MDKNSNVVKLGIAADREFVSVPRALLEKLEWLGGIRVEHGRVIGFIYCPACGNEKQRRHTAGCWIARVLGIG